MYCCLLGQDLDTEEVRWLSWQDRRDSQKPVPVAQGPGLRCAVLRPGTGSTTHGHLIAPEVSGRLGAWERTARGLPVTASAAWTSAPKPPTLSPFNHSVTALLASSVSCGDLGNAASQPGLSSGSSPASSFAFLRHQSQPPAEMGTAASSKGSVTLSPSVPGTKTCSRLERMSLTLSDREVLGGLV